MRETEFDVLVVGELNADLIMSGDVAPEYGQVEKLIDDASLVLGSSSAIFACGAARLRGFTLSNRRESMRADHCFDSAAIDPESHAILLAVSAIVIEYLASKKNPTSNV